MPRAIRQQWSPLNVPLMWAAAGGDANHPVLEWLENATRRVQEPMEFHGNQTTADAAVREGWIVLRWGVISQEQLTDWMVRQGQEFPSGTTSRPGPRSSSWRRRHA